MITPSRAEALAIAALAALLGIPTIARAWGQAAD